MADRQHDDDTEEKTYDVEDFDLVLMTSCDIHGVARGRFVFRGGVKSMIKNGVGMTPAAMFFGIKCDIPVNLTEYLEAGWANGALMPDVSTIRPLSWISYGGRKVGHLLCDLNDAMGKREESGAREVAIKQLDSLKTLGFDIVSSAELQVTVFHKETLTPVGLHEDISKLLSKLVTSLKDSGLAVSSVSRGLEDGKLLVSLGRQRGIKIADNLHRLRNAVRSICAHEGYDVTYMTKPLSDATGNGNSFCYTLFTRNNRNVFSDENNKGKLSTVARHWLAGSLHHHAAVTSLVRPTLNCYSKDDLLGMQADWDDSNTNRMCRLRVCGSGNSLSITERLPSSASNPYVVLAALIAAGIEGVVKKMVLPGQMLKNSETPPTLPQALIALENDEAYKDVIGSRFVGRFLGLKREYEVLRQEENQKTEKPESQLDLERTIYMKML